MSDLKETLLQALEAVWCQGNVSAIEKFYHPDFVMHYSPMKGGSEAVATFSDLANDLTELKKSFPDFNEVVHDLICDGNKVVARLTLSGTQATTYNGFPSLGKKFSINSIDIYKFEEEKIIEQWGVKENTTMHKQLGWL